MTRRATVRFGGFSRQIDCYAWGWVGGLLCVTMLLAFAVLMMGTVPLSGSQVLRAFFVPETRETGQGFILWQLRLPRLILAAMVGGALALSGLILQSLIRNPLASPDLLGVTSGASAAALAFLSFGAGSVSQRWLPLAAIGGAWATAALITSLAWRRGVSPYRLVLIGVGVSALMGAVATALLLLSPFNTTLSSYLWLTGSVYGANWDDVVSLTLWLTLMMPWVIRLARHLPIHELDEQTAIGLGASRVRGRGALLLVSVASAGVAIAHAGAVAFVGLVAPHMARRLVGRAFVSGAWVAMLLGANLVMVADVIGRTLFLPADLPAGIFISALGSPFFLYLLIRQRK